MSIQATRESGLGRVFFTPLYRPAGALDVFRWWESRRLLYNVCVGATGLLSIAWVDLLALLSGRGLGFPLGGVVAVGVLANLCYTLGPVVELLVRKYFGTRGAAAGPVLLRYGFVFSMGLTLLPIPLATIGFLLRAIF